MKAEVQRAVGRLAAFLARKDAGVRVIELPLGPDGAKQAPDDFIATGHTVEELLALATTKVPQPDRTPLTLVDAAEVDTWDFPRLEVIVEVLLPRVGVVSLGGPPKRYKSLLALYTALSIACRRQLVAKKFRVVENPRVLYIAREDGGARLRDRIGDILAAWGTRPAAGAIRFAIRPQLDLGNAEDLAQIRETCQRERIGLLILDTLLALTPSVDPLSAKDQARIGAALTTLAAEIEGTILIVDHTRKNRAEGQAIGTADLYGPVQKAAVAEHLVMLDLTREARRVEVFVEGKDVETSRFFLTVSEPGSRDEKFTYAGTVEEAADARRTVGSGNRAAILRTVSGVAALTAGEVWAWLGTHGGPELSRATIHRHLAGLFKARQVDKMGHGEEARYRAVVRMGSTPFDPPSGRPSGSQARSDAETVPLDASEVSHPRCENAETATPGNDDSPRGERIA